MTAASNCKSVPIFVWIIGFNVALPFKLSHIDVDVSCLATNCLCENMSGTCAAQLIQLIQMNGSAHHQVVQKLDNYPFI